MDADSRTRPSPKPPPPPDSAEDEPRPGRAPEEVAGPPEPPRRRTTSGAVAPPPAPSRAGWAVAGAMAVILGAAYFLVHAPVAAELESAAVRRDEAIAANAELVSERDALRAEVEKTRAQQAELAAQAAVTEQALQAMKRTQEELQSKLQEEIDKGTVAVSEEAGELVVDLIDKIVFEPGESQINESGLAVLREVGETLKKVPDKMIQVSGHTDTTRISKNLIERFPTNWELASARATNVVRFLHEELKIPGNRLATVGYAEFQPIAKNSTTSGRRKNRRIEVRLVPLRAVRNR